MDGNAAEAAEDTPGAARKDWPWAPVVDGDAAFREAADAKLETAGARVRSTTTGPVGSLGEDRSSVAKGVEAGESYDGVRGAGFRVILKREALGFTALAGNGVGDCTEGPEVAAAVDPAAEEDSDAFTASTGPP